MIENPQTLSGSTQNEIAQILGDGWTAGSYGSSGTGWKFINDTHFDLMVFHHNADGVHGGAYYVFEAMDVSIGYCSRRILTKFLDEGIIDEEIFKCSLLLSENFRRLEDAMLIRSAESIRNSLEWKKLMELSDNINKMIKTKWTDEDLQAIFKFEQPINLNT